MLALPEALLGPSRGSHRPSWGNLDAIWSNFGAILDPLGASVARERGILKIKEKTKVHRRGPQTVINSNVQVEANYVV